MTFESKVNSCIQKYIKEFFEITNNFSPIFSRNCPPLNFNFIPSLGEYMTKKMLSQVPILFRQKVETLIDINSGYSTRYLNQLPQLEAYKREHPTKIIVFKCMDERILFSLFTQTPLGLLSNFRNLGGQFNFGWHSLQTTLKEVMNEAHQEHMGRLAHQAQAEMIQRSIARESFIDNYLSLQKGGSSVINWAAEKHAAHTLCEICNDGNMGLAIVTYHCSETDNKHFGCAGSKCNKDKSIRDAKGFRMQMEKGCADWRCRIYSMLVGINTDTDGLMLHGENGQVRCLESLSENVTDNELFSIILELYPSMPMQIRFDLLSLMRGNIRHIAAVRKSQRPIEQMGHMGWALGIGRSRAYNWLHEPNTAILVGLFNPDLPKVIRKGIEVIKPNAKKGFILMTAAPYGKNNPKSFARQQAKYYSRLGQEQIKEYYHDLLPFMFPLRLLVSEETQLFEMI